MEVVNMILKKDLYEEHSENDQDDIDEDEMPTTFNGDLPCSVIVTNLCYTVFDDSTERETFESNFLDIDETATFHYFKSFRRVRINFSTSDQANEARFRMHLKEYNGYTLKCYFTQPITIGNSSHLEPPKREKQFLISPPASPPVGWEPMDEAHPSVNYDLLSAMASLAPGEAHELHPPTKDQPGIVVHICEEDEASLNPQGLRIPQTRRPAVE